MQQKKQILLTLAATVILVGLSWLAGASRPKVAWASVAVASCEIPAGGSLKAGDIALIRMPVESVQPDWFSDPDSAVGLFSPTGLVAGEILHARRLSDQPEGIQYPGPGPGRRLMTLRLDRASANGYWLAAGCRVDLHLVPRGAADQPVQVLKNITVLRVLDGATQSGLAVVAGPQSKDLLLCLDLSVKEAALLAFADIHYSIRLAVVNE
jgi:Flp pilus assembly protein CpaB